MENQQDKALLRKLVNYCWRKGMLGYKLDALQSSITDTLRVGNHKKVCILSSRQIGKSYWACVHALEYLIKHPGKIARIVAPTLDQCHDIVQDNLVKILQDAPKGFVVRRKSELRWDFINGSSLRLGGLKRAHVDSNRGGNASLIVYEECGFVSGDDFNYGVNSVLGPQLLRSKGKEIYVSTPSEEPDHPLHTLVKPQCEDLGSFFAYSVYDSPSITPEMIEEAARRCGGENTEAFRREYLAEIVRPESLMVVPFEESVHVGNFHPSTTCKWSVTIDWGGVRDKTVALLHCYNFLSDQDLIMDELVFSANTPTRTIVVAIQSMISSHNVHIEQIFADVPGQLQVDLHDTYKINVSLPPKSDWLAGINSMATRFIMKKILIHPRCKFLIKSCRSGMFNKQRTDFLRSEDLGHCDALAALMYALKTRDTTPPVNRSDIIMGQNQIFPMPEHDQFKVKRFGAFR